MACKKGAGMTRICLRNGHHTKTEWLSGCPEKSQHVCKTPRCWYRPTRPTQSKPAQDAALRDQTVLTPDELNAMKKTGGEG